MTLYPANPGQANNAGTVDALFLKMFSGRVETAFERDTVMRSLINLVPIDEGKSFQFPRTGRANGQHYLKAHNIFTDQPGIATPTPNTAGDNYMANVPSDEIDVFVDRPYVVHDVIDKWDKMISHYAFQEIYVRQFAEDIARDFDKKALFAGFVGADSSGYAGLPGGTVLVEPGFESNGSAAADVLFQAKQTFMDNHVPIDNRLHAVVSPATYSRLSRQTDLLTHDINQPNGSLREGDIFKVAGIWIHPSTTLATDARVSPGYTSADGIKEPAAYNGNWTTSRALIFHESAIGGVELEGLTTDAEKRLEFAGGTALLSQMTYGLKALRPEALIRVDAS